MLTKLQIPKLKAYNRELDIEEKFTIFNEFQDLDAHPLHMELHKNLARFLSDPMGD